MERLCQNCKKRPAAFLAVTCEECLIKRRKWDNTRRQKEKLSRKGQGFIIGYFPKWVEHIKKSERM